MGVSSPLRILPCRKCPRAILSAQTLPPEETVASAPRAPAAAAAALRHPSSSSSAREVIDLARARGHRSLARTRLGLPPRWPCRQDAAPPTSLSSVSSSPRPRHCGIRCRPARRGSISLARARGHRSRARARLGLPHWRPCRQDAAPPTSSSSVSLSPRSRRRGIHRRPAWRGSISLARARRRRRRPRPRPPLPPSHRRALVVVLVQLRGRRHATTGRPRTRRHGLRRRRTAAARPDRLD